MPFVDLQTDQWLKRNTQKVTARMREKQGVEKKGHYLLTFKEEIPAGEVNPQRIVGQRKNFCNKRTEVK
jgi:hypothetical protein